jgi:hypothetical protein
LELTLFLETTPNYQIQVWANGKKRQRGRDAPSSLVRGFCRHMNKKYKLGLSDLEMAGKENQLSILREKFGRLPAQFEKSWKEEDTFASPQDIFDGLEQATQEELPNNNFEPSTTPSCLPHEIDLREINKDEDR